jgi:hypothetical protein
MTDYSLKEAMNSYDSVPLLDIEYNHPGVQNAVLSLIQEEMTTMQASSSSKSTQNYLKDLPYPKLRFSGAPGFAQEYEAANIKNKQQEKDGKMNATIEQSHTEKYSLSQHLDMSRYKVTAPSGELENNIEAWQNAVENARIQHEHQQNRLLNLQLESDPQYGNSIWRDYAVALEGRVAHTNELVVKNEKIKNNMNSSRITKQKDVAPTLGRLLGKRNETVMRTLQLQQVIHTQQQQAQQDHHSNKKQKIV